MCLEHQTPQVGGTHSVDADWSWLLCLYKEERGNHLIIKSVNYLIK
jgi:hypothetical protein